MARKEDTGFIEQHAEKIVLAVATVIMLFAVLHWGVESPRKIKLEIKGPGIRLSKDAYSPDKVDSALETGAKDLERLLEGIEPKIQPLPNSRKRLKEIYKEPYDTRFVHPYVNLVPGRLPPAHGPKTVPTIEPVKLADLLPLPKPEKPPVLACREVQVRPGQAGADVKYKEVKVAHGAGVFEYGKVLNKWREALKKTYVPARVVFVAVEAQRRSRLPNGSWSEAEPVSMVIVPDAPPLPTIPAPDGKNLPEIQQKVTELAWLSNQKYILEPDYWDIIWPNRRTGTWQIHNHKPRTRVSDLLEQAEEKSTMPHREGGERLREGAERGSAERLAAERRARLAAEKLAAERRAAERRSRLEAERRRSSAGERGREGAERGGERRERAPADRRATDRRAAERRAAERRAAERRAAVERRTVPRLATEPDAPSVVPIPSLQEQLDNPAGILEVWFHDTSLKEGMAYSYRFRLVLVNPLLGRFKDAADKDDAKILALRTPWSDWSESVEVKRPTEFFLVGNAPQMGTVEVEVFTQRWGQRVSERFRVRQGEPIGGDVSKELLRLDNGRPEKAVVSFRTGAIAVSFDFKKKQRIAGTNFFRTTTELLYLDTRGRLRTRTEFEDDSSSRRKELLNEVRQANRALAGVR